MKTLNNIPESFSEKRFNAVRRLASIKHAHLQSFSAGVNSVDVCKFIVFTLSCKGFDRVTVWAVDHNESLYKESFKRNNNGRVWDRTATYKRENREFIAQNIVNVRGLLRDDVSVKLHTEWATVPAVGSYFACNISAAAREAVHRAI